MDGLKGRPNSKPPYALDAFLAARDGVRRRMDAAAQAQRETRPIPVEKTLNEIKSGLSELGLFNDESLLLITQGSVRIVLDATGQVVTTALFKRVNAPLAFFSWGPFSREYSAKRRPLKASTDDMAQMFGAAIPYVRRPERPANAYLIVDQGFVVTGRYPSELIAAAILVEKGCKTELLAPSIGTVNHLPALLAAAERAVYLAAYSKGEKEAHDV